MPRVLPPLAAALTLATVAGLLAAPAPAAACGGFFCGQQPVDQQAERVVFAVGESSTDMIVQIGYRGRAEDFAWLLPLAEVPEAASLDVFPERALVALDANTAPVFWRPEEDGCLPPPLLNGGGSDANTPGVTVHLSETVGPYDVVVIESEDAMVAVQWLRDHAFRVTERMIPMVAEYTEAGMKLLALRLSAGRDATDIEPFRLGLPGTSPSIPLKLTAIAAEPHMGILVFVLGAQRWGPANWPEVEIDDSEIVWAPHAWPAETNWTALVAEKVDEAGGRGWVTELAGPTEPYVEQVRAAIPRTEEDELAQQALLELLETHPYMTRMYSRLSPEEMTSDPIFRRHGGEDVDRARQLSRYVDGRDLCTAVDGSDEPTTACDFVYCGSGASCEPVSLEAGGQVSGCVCPAGAAARTTFDAIGTPVVACQDPTVSFLRPGDRELPELPPLPDPCATFDCGEGGECVPVNLTPTCRCDAGLVAIGWLADDGTRRTRCVDPAEPTDLIDSPPRPPPPGSSSPPPSSDPPVDGGSAADGGTDAGPAGFTPGGGGCGIARATITAGGRGAPASASSPGDGAATAAWLAFAGLLLLARRRR